jgi:hypothetical protein
MFKWSPPKDVMLKKPPQLFLIVFNISYNIYWVFFQYSIVIKFNPKHTTCSRILLKTSWCKHIKDLQHNIIFDIKRWKIKH